MSMFSAAGDPYFARAAMNRSTDREYFRSLKLCALSSKTRSTTSRMSASSTGESILYPASSRWDSVWKTIVCKVSSFTNFCRRSTNPRMLCWCTTAAQPRLFVSFCSTMCTAATSTPARYFIALFIDAFVNRTESKILLMLPEPQARRHSVTIMRDRSPSSGNMPFPPGTGSRGTLDTSRASPSHSVIADFIAWPTQVTQLWSNAAAAANVASSANSKMSSNRAGKAMLQTSSEVALFDEQKLHKNCREYMV
mmetsp:Transcript_5756/g.17154  ORF Transcript_5756/g.17154 Transcript_5756/m.17154 type:complete len:252 (-) Transcript_5756:455-1210(-)